MEMDYGGECSTSSASSSAVAPQPQEPILLHPDVPDQMVCVKTGDGCRFSVRLMAMRHSNLYMLNAFLPNGEIMKEFDLGDISGMMFQKILEWCQHYPEVPHLRVEVDPHTRERRWFTFSQFHQVYFNMQMEDLEELIASADYMQVQSLYLYACQAAAAQLKGKTPDQIRDILGLTDDMTDEEKDAIRRENNPSES